MSSSTKLMYMCTVYHFLHLWSCYIIMYLQGMWSRCFPVYHRIRQELAEGVIGQPRVVTASFGYAGQEKRRVSEKELGGGAVLDVGIYPIQLADMVFGPDKPEKIVATGTLLESGR